MGFLQGKKGLVFGVANDRSIGWALAKAAYENGASVGLSYQGDRVERRVRPLAESISAPICAPCDVRKPEELDRFFDEVSTSMGSLDFLVHSIAFAPREDLSGRFVETTTEGFLTALQVSAFSLVDLASRARPLMNEGGSILTMTYIGAEKVIPNYNVMGPAKAALEANVRYLASDLGPDGIRVNGMSAGPIKTLAAAGIPGFRDMLKQTAGQTPLQRNVTFKEIGQAGVFLLSDMSSGVTGEILHVDCGYHVMGAPRHGH